MKCWSDFMLSNPMIICGAIALGIVLLLVLVVIICCVRSSKKEREELMMLSDEIDNGIDIVPDDKSEAQIENVLSKMQEAIEMKEETSVSFEEAQEENAIISYQELLASLGAKNSIDVDAIEVYDDELDNQIEISDFNKEIIDAYQNESLDREIYQFQNDFSSEEMPMEFVPEEAPVMNFDISEFEPEEVIEVQAEPVQEVYEAKHVVGNHKFKSSEFISPVYGIIKEEPIKENVEEIEEIIFEDDSF